MVIHTILCLCLANPGFAPPQPPQKSIPQEELPATSAAEQLAVAKKIKNAVRGKKGEERFRQLRQAAQAFARVARDWPHNKGVVAEACFRRGEILRSLGEAGAARGAFEDVLEVAPSHNDFGVRALLELGHLCRRAQQHKDAVAFYQRARDCKGVSLRYQNDGREWIARTWALGLAWAASLSATEDWVQHAEGPVERIHAVDWQIHALLQMGRVKEAQAALDALLGRVQVLAAAPTKEGEQVKKTLGRMKAPKRLAAAKKAQH